MERLSLCPAETTRVADSSSNSLDHLIFRRLGRLFIEKMER